MDELTLVYAISSIVALLAVRVLWVLFEVMSKRRSSFDDSAVAKAAAKQSKQLKTLVIAGSGGHTAEILKLLSSMKLTRYTPRCYVIATTDAHSESKIRAFEATSADAQQSFAIWKIPRSREVKQSYVSSIFTTINACLYALPIALRARADIVLCNGPGTCIPICAAIFLMKVFFIKPRCRIVFVESICRVTTLSLSGKLLYYFADQLVVQWPTLHALYPRTVYLGRVV